jgi:anti-anti-sigma factor
MTRIRRKVVPPSVSGTLQQNQPPAGRAGGDPRRRQGGRPLGPRCFGHLEFGGVERRGSISEAATLRLLGVSAFSERRELFVDTAPARLVQSGRITIQVHTEDDLYLISLIGELDLSTTRVLDAEIVRAEESSAGRIVLDLSGVEFIDSSGLELLVCAKRRSNVDTDRLRIRPGRDQVTRLLALTKLDEFLKFEE